MACMPASSCLRTNSALEWGFQVHTFLESKPSMLELQDAMRWDPPPVSVPGWERLTQGFSAAQDWQQRASEVQPYAPALVTNHVSCTTLSADCM